MDKADDDAGLRSGVFGDESVTVRIVRLRDGAGVAKEVLSRPEIHALVRNVHIVPDEEDEDEDADSVNSTTEQDDDEEFPKPRKPTKEYLDRQLSKQCKPIIEILNAVLQAGGRLEEFVWNQDDWWDSKGTRPKEFWEALWKHAESLKVLDIGFYTHEVHEVHMRPPAVEFPALQKLIIDTTTAHGDDGSCIEHILSSSPNLTSLAFFYPGCDLDTCQIQNITWSYTFPSLRALTVEGYDFNPKAFGAFLERNEGIQSLREELDGFHDTDDNELVHLSADALPMLTQLYHPSHGSFRSLENWFDPQAKRKIRHLTVKTWILPDFRSAEAMGETLKCLEFVGTSKSWRPRVIENDSSDDEDEEKEAGSEKKQARIETPKLAEVVKRALPNLNELQELGICLETGNDSTYLGDGKWQDADPMNVEDLKRILSLLPPNTRIRALRLWDSRGEKLPQELLDDFVEIPESLEYLGWEAEEKVLYRLERRDGKVRAVACEPPRQKGDGEEWTEGRILDY